jgi:prophage maintenance system killer protein
MVNRITIKIVEEITFEMAQKDWEFDEPIPNFHTRSPNILESCLAAPFQTFENRFLIPNFITRASTMFYYMIKNHPFKNGNKRIATCVSLFK